MQKKVEKNESRFDLYGRRAAKGKVKKIKVMTIWLLLDY
jgi:hypothetical protein